ncbi:MAG: ATP-dependent DNA helicase RecQ [Euryarchaeota archaeon HGW-Euryarchaeota-1]|nr:MAG: ATP-dependent DNA helicase RecQ [Euryarchaeota archaeon HGW-Euryarchaeota-1]
MVDSISKNLKCCFGYDEFKPKQKEVVESILAGNDNFVMMPTGSGKSLCYQLPALILPGLTLVISPLIALMKDQVDSLKAKGVNAEFINSSLPQNEIARIQNDALSGKLKLLYIAPERMASDTFISFLTTINLSLIAVDEAHCISEWGHDFRPEYGNLKMLKKFFPKIPIIALTATAQEQTRLDILKQLAIENAKIFISSIDRPNLNFQVIKKKNAMEKLIFLLKNYPDKSVIIYCFSRNDTEKIANKLRQKRFKAIAYHAGMDALDRINSQELFIDNKINIIVATTAFGMGIDKSNIRLVVHYTFPKSLESYYQEVGRAGRDGLPSECVMFYTYGDLYKYKHITQNIAGNIAKTQAARKLNEMIEYAELKSCRRQYILRYFGEVYNKDNCGSCDFCNNNIFAKEADTNNLANSQNNIAYKEADTNKEQKENKFSSDFFRIKEEKNTDILKSLIDKTNKEQNSAQELKYDVQLFDKLRALRKQIAQNLNVPAFIIFNDISLKEMAYFFPEKKDGFLQITGVGNRKLENFGDEFLKVIANHIKENNLSSKEINNNQNKTNLNKQQISKDALEIMIDMLNKKMSIADIALARGLATSTIISHLELLITSGAEIDLDYLKHEQEIYNKIARAFQFCGDEKLRPVFEYLNKEYDYETIKLVHIIMKSKQ